MRAHVIKRPPATKGGAVRARPWGYIFELGTAPDGSRQQAMHNEVEQRRSGSHLEPNKLTR